MSKRIINNLKHIKMTKSERLSLIMTLTEKIVDLYNCNGGRGNERIIKILKNKINKLAAL